MSVADKDIKDFNKVIIESSDDEFGNFSDASFEEDLDSHSNINDNNSNNNNKDIKDTTYFIDECFPLFDTNQIERKNVTDFNKDNLSNLLSDERCNIIYQQLLNNEIMSDPIIWNRSHIRSTMLQILGIKDVTKKPSSENDDYNKKVILDDSLFLKICQLIDNSSNSSGQDDKIGKDGRVSMTLRDHFKIKYSPIVKQKPKALIDKETTDDILLNEIIPNLLKFNIHDETKDDDADGNEKLVEYHDKLCNMIDKLVLQLKSIKQEQNELMKDKITFENVVTNLSGHTQRLQRDEIALYNKKMKRKRKNKFVVSSSNGHHSHNPGSKNNNNNNQDKGTNKSNDENVGGRKSSNTSKSSNQWKRFSWVGLQK